MRVIITMGCEECKERNYTTTKNKRIMPDRFAKKKYCSRCNKHTMHKETK
ncbi:MAG: 50S ribosomal protein L33 [Pseudomonadota bacterium]|nr:50S ribosomal protein L33 [Pseudomonadota bacterium]